MAFLDNILKKDQKDAKAEKKTSLALKTNVPVLLKRPYMTEKASILAESGKYIFEIDPSANKTEIKKTIKNFYKVDVEKINKITVLPKKRRWGKKMGKTSGLVKVIVTVKKGQKIDVLK